MIGLTPQQMRLLRFICRSIDRNGIAPTFEQMADEMGLKSKSGIHRLLVGLEDRGHVRRHAGRSRGIEILVRPDSTLDDKLRSAEAEIKQLRALIHSNGIALPERVDA